MACPCPPCGSRPPAHPPCRPHPPTRPPSAPGRRARWPAAPPAPPPAPAPAPRAAAAPPRLRAGRGGRWVRRARHSIAQPQGQQRVLMAAARSNTASHPATQPPTQPPAHPLPAAPTCVRVRQACLQHAAPALGVHQLALQPLLCALQLEADLRRGSMVGATGCWRGNRVLVEFERSDSGGFPLPAPLLLSAGLACGPTPPGAAQHASDAQHSAPHAPAPRHAAAPAGPAAPRPGRPQPPRRAPARAAAPPPAARTPAWRGVGVGLGGAQAVGLVNASWCAGHSVDCKPPSQKGWCGTSRRQSRKSLCPPTHLQVRDVQVDLGLRAALRLVQPRHLVRLGGQLWGVGPGVGRKVGRQAEKGSAGGHSWVGCEAASGDCGVPRRQPGGPPLARCLATAPTPALRLAPVSRACSSRVSSPRLPDSRWFSCASAS